MAAVPAAAPAIITTAQVANALIVGALEYVGGALLSSAIGGGGAKIGDVKGWIEQAVRDLEAFVADQFEKHEVEDIASYMDSVKSELDVFAGLSPAAQKNPRSLGNLQASNQKLVEIMDKAAAHPSACSAAIVGLGYALLIRQILYNYDRPNPTSPESSYIVKLKDYFENWLRGLCASREAIAKGLSPGAHVRVACSANYHALPSAPDTLVGDMICCVIVDRIAVKATTVPIDPAYNGSPGEPVAEAAARSALQADYISARLPFAKTEGDFRDAVNKSLRVAIKTYTAMCKQIGIVYTKPNDIDVPDGA
jgi:hypothetical protein